MAPSANPAIAALLEHADDGVRPQDDLFGQVNGSWLAEAPIPGDLPSVGGFIDLQLQAEAEVGDILRAAADDPDATGHRAQIGDLFASFTDTDRIEALGTSPLDEDLAAIAAIGDARELLAVIGRLQREGLAGAAQAFVSTDDRDSDRYLLHLEQGGIGLPDEAYYREDAFAELRDAYVAHIAAMLGLLGDDEATAADAAARIMALETRLAGDHWDNVACRDVIATYNLTTWAELAALAPEVDWDGWWAALTADATPPPAELLVRQPSFVEGLSQAVAEVPLDDWRDWLRFHLLSGAAPHLSDEVVETDFDFTGRVLTGTQHLRARWKRAVRLCNGLMGEAVGQQFVARHFPPEAKAQMDELVANLVEAYRVSISRLAWMTPATRERALEKLGRFRSKIGYPDRWRDYSTLVIDRADLVGNVRRAAAFETDRQVAKLGSPVDRDEWFMAPQTVNAYYNPGTNEICFPAAILRPPFFSADADPACNYGGIGAVIGHEIGHGFDDQGSQYDGDGNLVDWWTDDDRAAFRERAEALIAQYDGFEPRNQPGSHVNGALTVGENIGDLGGLTIGLLAYRLSLGGAEPPVVEGMGGVERLLRNWALIWRIKARPEMERQLLAVDPHSPPEFRANIVRNLDDFHETFATAPGDDLWLDPEARVSIW